jgi:hypothetical protein
MGHNTAAVGESVCPLGARYSRTLIGSQHPPRWTPAASVPTSYALLQQDPHRVRTPRDGLRQARGPQAGLPAWGAARLPTSYALLQQDLRALTPLKLGTSYVSDRPRDRLEVAWPAAMA